MLWEGEEEEEEDEPALSVTARSMMVQVWGRDADSFRPERWENNFDPGLSFLPFLRGPRDCVGRNFAMLEAAVVLSMLYKEFTFRQIEGEPEESLSYSVTLKPMHGVRVIPVHRR